MAAQMAFWCRIGLAACVVVPMVCWAEHDSGDGAEGCIDPVSYWPLDPDRVGRVGGGGADLGTYERVSPDGRFILRSYSGAKLGQVSLIELPEKVSGALLSYRTPLSNEAFPVQGSWRYLVDVDGTHYRFGDILRQEAQAKPLFKGGMKGFYAAAAELANDEGGDSSLIWIRSMSWPQGGRMEQGTGPLQVRTIGLRDRGDAVQVIRDTGPQFICGARSQVDGRVYTLPMLSVDGHEFSAIPINPGRGQPSMRVYGLSGEAMSGEHPCDLHWDLHATPGKAVFGFANAGAAMLAYTDNGSVYFVDRRDPLQDQVFQIEDLHTRVIASAFPGITRDGRIIFAATWQDCDSQGRCVGQAGYVVADPFQNPDYRHTLESRGLLPAKTCITHRDVIVERRRFAEQQGLVP